MIICYHMRMLGGGVCRDNLKKMEKSMKKLLTALATAATAALGFAEITAREDFEDSSYTAYDNDKPLQDAAYPFDGYGDYYRSLDDDGEEELFEGDASCVDAVMQFKYADVPDEFNGDEKLVVFANSDGKLVVVDADATNVTTTAITEDTWYRLTIVSVDETVNDATVKKFKVYVDGVLAETEGGTDSFTSRVADSNSVTKMTLSGTGKVDNFVARTTDPFGSAPAGWIANIGTADPEQYFTDYTKALEKALAGATLTFADGVTEMDGTAAHPFEIRTAADLKALAAAVNAGESADKCFVQTADIDMSEAGAFAGIGVYAANPTAGKPFAGTYDGGNFKISNVDFTQRNYGGVFNQVNGGTIKNLTVENITCSTFSASVNEGEWGGAIVGNAGNGATLQNLVAKGSFGTASCPCTHNVAGIAVRLSEGGTLVQNCTNNATLYGTYTKLGGICALTQTQTGITGVVTFDGCVNNGNIVATANANGKNPGVDGIAGIVAYVTAKTVLQNCSNDGGVFSSTYASAPIAELVGKVNGGKELTGNGGNSGDATKKLVGERVINSTVAGFDYATVANGVATTVTTLAKDGAYLLEGNVAASETPVFTFAEAGTIAFDAALGYTFAGTVDAVSSLAVTTSTSGTVTTYTAAAAVAKIDDTKYTSLAAAVDDAAEGSTIILLADVALTETQTISKSVTLDLNGKNVTATDCRAFHVTAGNVVFAGSGTISTVVTQNTGLADSSSVIRVGSNTAETNFTLGENVTVTSDYCYGITYFGTMKQTVVINGTVTVTGVQAAISGNGLATYNKAAGGSDVTVNGTVSATQDYAIYNPQTGTTVINGTVTGPGGIEVKAGTVTVGANAQITATGTPSYTQSNQNGTSTVGYAIAAVGNKSYQQPATVSVASGATVTGTVIILKENGSETYGEITSAANTLTIPEGYVWNGPADGVYTLAVASGFDGGEDGKTFTIDSEVTLPTGKALTDTVEGTTSGMTYAQAYALGLLDETTGEVAKDVTPTIEIKDGKVVVSLDANAKDAYKVTLTVYESTSLNANATWLVKATYELDSEDEAAGFTPSNAGAGFYKVGVTIEDAADPSGN